MGKVNSKSSRSVLQQSSRSVLQQSSRSVLQQNATDRMVENDRKTQSKANDSVVQHSTVDDGLNIKCVSLTSRLSILSHQMIPSKFEDCFKESGKQAKQLLVEYAASRAKTVIENERQNDGKGASIEIISALGSEEVIYSVAADCGMFAAVITAYSYHYNLRTSPDDWWFCVIKRVACAIEENSEKESVRNMFVAHAGKKTIEVQVDDPTIYTVNYGWFFDQITKKMKENVKVPEFVDGMTADFGTTTAVQKIVSQITLMYSVKQYFSYSMRTRCGIPAVEMLGTEEDWMKLTSKLKVVRTLLEPIENDLGLQSEWWDLVEYVFHNLQATYQGKPTETWWSHIMSYENDNRSGEISGWTGWITDFLEGPHEHKLRPDDFTSGLVSVPLTIKLSGEQDTAALVAGMLGFTVHSKPNSDEVSVQPFQGWSLMLADDSPFAK